MDLSQYLPSHFVVAANDSRRQQNEERRVKEGIQKLENEIERLDSECFKGLLYRTELENVVRNQEAILADLSEKMRSKLQHQNGLARIINEEHEKRVDIDNKTAQIICRMDRNKMEIAEKRRHIYELSKYYAQFHDSIQEVSKEITSLQLELNESENAEKRLENIECRIEETKQELEKVSSQMTVTQSKIAQLEQANEKLVRSNETLLRKKQETEIVLQQRTEENSKMMRILESTPWGEEPSITNKLDGLDAIFVGHKEDVSNLQKDHDASMLALEEERQKVATENETLLKAIEDLDGTLQVQKQQIAEAQRGLVKSSSKKASASSQEHRQKVDLEQQKCRLSQLEEQLMDLEMELNEADRPNVANVSRRDVLNLSSGAPMRITTKRTSTPNISFSSNVHSGTSRSGGRKTPPPPLPPVPQSAAQSPATSPSHRRSERSLAKRRKRYLDEVSSSTQR